MPITDDVRKYGETVLEQGKAALDEVRKPWYAAVGAGELAYGQLHEQLSQLPSEVEARIRKLQSSGAQVDAATVRSAVENAAGTYGTYAAQAREAYESLAHRGELVVRRLRRSPEVRSAFDRVENAVADAGKAVSKAEEQVTEPGRPVTRKPATNSTSTTSTARRSPSTAREAAATTRKAPSTARKAPAKRSTKS
jgi:hypothetical protein